MPRLNGYVRDAEAGQAQEFLRRLDYLVSGPDADSERIDAMLDPERRAVPGLGEAVVMKLLAVAHPDRYLPVYPYSGDSGKKRMLELLGLPLPDPALTRGQIQVDANDGLVEYLSAHFPGDTWGMNRFLYWLLDRPPGPVASTDVEVDPLTQLANSLLVDAAFLEELVALLEDKRQIVLSGPRHWKDISGAATSSSAGARRLAAAPGAIPPVDLLRGLLRGLQATARRR